MKQIISEPLRDIQPHFYCIRDILTCFKQKVENGWCFNGEAHDYWEMVYVLEGTVWISEEGRVYKLQSGDIIFHKPLEFHKIWCEDGPFARFQVISFSATNDDIESLGKDVYRLTMDAAEQLAELYAAILQAFTVNVSVERKAPEAQSLLLEKTAFLKLELFLLSLVSKTQKRSEARQHTATTNNYKLIMDTLQENLNYNLTIEEIAALCNMSVSNLKKTFNKYSDGGIMHHFTRMKIQRACRFLTADRSVESIASAFGFKSVSHFSVAFKRITGMTPTEFRKQN